MAMTDLTLHLQSPSGPAYLAQPAIRWSETLNRWCVFSPELIREVMRDRRFAVPSYDLTPLERRFGIDLSLTRDVVERIPLAMEGERHRRQRAEFARSIMAGSPAAQAAFETRLIERLATLNALSAGGTFCLVDDVLRPASRAMISALVDIPIDAIGDVEKIPQTFDDSVSIKRRRDIDALLRSIRAACPHADPLHRLGTIMVSANTLLGSLVRSLADQLQRNPGVGLAAIAWPRELPCTSLSLVEKTCLTDAVVGGVPIREGDRLRLYVEAAGIDSEGGHMPSDLFFAVGPHRCVGMSLSVAIWNCLTRILSGQRTAWTLVSQHVRPMDRVFNFPEKVVVVSHAC